MKHGKGVLVFKDGSSYNGTFSKNIIDGFGKYAWPDGKTYEGNWKEN